MRPELQGILHRRAPPEGGAQGLRS
jgi:hypothetical protein